MVVWRARTCVDEYAWGITFGTRPREIAKEEIRLAWTRHAPSRCQRSGDPAPLPQEFILDEQAGVHDPLA